ncbi:hypothetical protein D3C81_1575570 [compost metagenome]
MLLQLDVGLFEFRLLGFQPRLGVHQRAAALLQFLVGDAQLLLLDLQFLALALGLAEQVLQPAPVAGGAQRHTDRFADAVEQFHHIGSPAPGRDEAQFDHADDLALGRQRRGHDLGGARAAQCGGHRQIVGRQPAHGDHAVLGHGLSGQRLAGRQRGRRAVRIGQCPGGQPVQVAIHALIDHAHVGI